MNACHPTIAALPLNSDTSLPTEKPWHGRKYSINKKFKETLIFYATKGTFCLLSTLLGTTLFRAARSWTTGHSEAVENRTIFSYPELIASVIMVGYALYFIEQRKTKSFKIKKLVEELPLKLVPTALWIRKEDLICITLEKELDLSNGIIRGMDENKQTAFVLKINQKNKEMVLFPLQHCFKDKSYKVEINKEIVVLKDN
jgi:hypothetical protein